MTIFCGTNHGDDLSKLNAPREVLAAASPPLAESHSEAFSPAELSVLSEMGIERRQELKGGGMGQVFLVSDRVKEEYPGQPFVLKVLKPELAGDSTMVGRFESEIAVGVVLEHPNILALVRRGSLGLEGNGRLFFTTRFMEGGTLHDRLTLPCTDAEVAANLRHEAMEALVSVLLALHELHTHPDRPAVHRDVKPGNIFFDGKGTAYLGDFGIVAPLDRIERNDPTRIPHIESHVRPGHIVGTPYYLSPEAARGDPVSAKADLYSVGTILYQVLTGRQAHGGGEPNEVIRRAAEHSVTEAVWREPRIHPGLAVVLRTLVEKLPMYRYSTALEAAGALRSALKNAPKGGLLDVADIPTIKTETQNHQLLDLNDLTYAATPGDLPMG